MTFRVVKKYDHSEDDSSMMLRRVGLSSMISSVPIT